MDEGEGVPMHTPIHSPAHSPIHSPTLQRAANVPTAELLRALMATVGDLALSVAHTDAQQAQTTLHMHAVSNFLAQPREGGRRPEFHGEPARFDGSGDVEAWLRTLELIFDAKRLNPEERFLHTLPLLAKSALKIYEYSHPKSYPRLCDMLTQRFSDKHDRFHKFSHPVALRQGLCWLDEYMEKISELQTLSMI